MTAVEILRATKQTLASPKKWTKRCFARDQKGVAVPFASDDACSRCLLGALYFHCDQKHWLEVLSCFPFPFQMDLITSHINAFNDSENTKHSDVIDLLDQAITKAEATA